MDGGSENQDTRQTNTPTWDERFNAIVDPQLKEATSSMASGSPMWATPNWLKGQKTISDIGSDPNYYDPQTNAYFHALKGQSDIADADNINKIRSQYKTAFGGDPKSDGRYGFALSDYLARSKANLDATMAGAALSNQRNQLAALGMGQEEPYRRAQQYLSLAQLGRGGISTGNTVQTSELGPLQVLGMLAGGAGSVMGGLGSMGMKIG